MRTAEAQDWWRALKTRDCKRSFVTVSISGCPGVIDHDFHVESRIFALCGPNGSFKSSVINAVYAACSGSITPAFLSRLEDSRICVQLRREGKIVPQNYPSGVGETKADAVLLDGSMDIFTCVNWARSTDNLEELVEAYGASTGSDEERRHLGYACGKEYREIKFYELEEVDGQNTMPFFTVSTREGEYDSRTMGFGEYTIFHIYWLLRRAPDGCIVLLEEPENYIPPKAQSSLMDVIAKLCVTRNLCLAVTTHSEHVIEKVPEENVFYMRREPEGYRVKSVRKDAKHLISIGVAPFKKDILLVEDYAAKKFLLALLSEFSEKVYPTYEVVIAGSSGNIEKNLQVFPFEGHAHRIVGVHDADAREHKGKPQPRGWRRLFFPGAECPEAEIKEAIEKDVQRASQVLGLEPEELAESLALTAGVDIHEFPGSIVENTRMSSDHFWLYGVRLWLEVSGRREEAENLVVDIANALTN